MCYRMPGRNPDVGCDVGAIAGLGWLVLGKNTSTEDLQLVAHLMAFTSFGTAVAWIVAMVLFWYIRLSAVLRQAEAD